MKFFLKKTLLILCVSCTVSVVSARTQEDRKEPMSIKLTNELYADSYCMPLSVGSTKGMKERKKSKKTSFLTKNFPSKIWQWMKKHYFISGGVGSGTIVVLLFAWWWQKENASSGQDVSSQKMTSEAFSAKDRGEDVTSPAPTSSAVPQNLDSSSVVSSKEKTENATENFISNPPKPYTPPRKRVDMSVWLSEGFSPTSPQ